MFSHVQPAPRAHPRAVPPGPRRRAAPEILCRLHWKREGYATPRRLLRPVFHARLFEVVLEQTGGHSEDDLDRTHAVWNRKMADLEQTVALETLGGEVTRKLEETGVLSKASGHYARRTAMGGKRRSDAEQLRSSVRLFFEVQRARSDTEQLRAHDHQSPRDVAAHAIAAMLHPNVPLQLVPPVEILVTRKGWAPHLRIVPRSLCSPGANETSDASDRNCTHRLGWGRTYVCKVGLGTGADVGSWSASSICSVLQ